MIYAPVLIPTLNRYEHLRKCWESLSRCTWADQIEVYFAPAFLEYMDKGLEMFKDDEFHNPIMDG